MALMNDQQAIARGHRAENELALTGEAFDGLKAALVAQIEAGEQVERAAMALQILSKVRSALEQIVQDGDAARAYVRHAEDLTKAGFTPA